jgi:hypothetical protein
MQVERDEIGGAAHNEVKGQRNLDAADGVVKSKCVAAHAFRDNDAFIEVPLLRMDCEKQHKLRIFAHAAQAFAAAEHEPHLSRLKRNLSFSGFKIVASYGSYALELDAF